MKRRLLAWLLCVCMVIGMMPVNVAAEEEAVEAQVSLSVDGNVVSVNIDEPNWNAINKVQIVWDEGVAATVGVSSDFVSALSSGISYYVSNPEKGETAAGEFLASAVFTDESGGGLSYTGTAWTLTFEDADHLAVTLYDKEGTALQSVVVGHTWGSGEITKQATCTEDGVMTYTCTKCDETKTEVIPAAHTWDDGVVTKEPTETKCGEITYTCKVCGATITEEYTPPAQLSLSVDENVVSLNIDKPGWYTFYNNEIAWSEDVLATVGISTDYANVMHSGSQDVFTMTVSNPEVGGIANGWFRTAAAYVNSDGGACVYTGTAYTLTFDDPDHLEVTLYGEDETALQSVIVGHTWDNGTAANGKLTYRCTVCGETKTIDLFKTTETEDGVAITGYNGTDQVVTIPSEIDGKTVTAIGDFAFESGDLTEVEIPSTVTSIGICAFYRCAELTKVTIPSSVTAIGYGAFMNCTNLQEVTFEGETIPEFGTYTFCSKNLQTIYVPDASYDAYVEALSGQVERTVAFQKLSEKILSTETPETNAPATDTPAPDAPVTEAPTTGTPAPEEPKYETKKVDDGVEISGYDGTGTTVTIPAEIDGEAVTAIGENAFAGSNMTKVVLPKSVTSIGSGAFANCENLESIIILGEEITIAGNAFEGCGSVTIKCLKNSTAQQYAKDHGLQYESLYYYGDVDLSGDLSASDALSILKCVVKLTDFTDATVKALAHASHQSEIGASDALAVLKTVVKLTDAEVMIP